MASSTAVSTETLEDVSAQAVNIAHRLYWAADQRQNPLGRSTSGARPELAFAYTDRPGIVRTILACWLVDSASASSRVAETFEQAYTDGLERAQKEIQEYSDVVGSDTGVAVQSSSDMFQSGSEAEYLGNRHKNTLGWKIMEQARLGSQDAVKIFWSDGFAHQRTKILVDLGATEMRSTGLPGKVENAALELRRELTRSRPVLEEFSSDEGWPN